MNDEHIKVRIIGNHPNSGETGKILVIDGMIDVKDILGVDMYEVHLEQCPHGTDSCFATRDNLRILEVSESGKRKGEQYNG